MAKQKTKSLSELSNQRLRIQQKERQRIAREMGVDVNELPNRNITARMEKADEIYKRYADNIRRRREYKDDEKRIKAAREAIRGKSMFKPSAEKNEFKDAIVSQRQRQYGAPAYMGIAVG